MNSPLTASFDREAMRALRQELTEAGVFEAPTTWSWLKFGSTATAGLSLVLLCTMVPTVAAFFILPCAAILLTVAALMGHESAHNAACGTHQQNVLMTRLAFPLMSGLSERFWRYKHNRIHHKHTNVVGLDRDLEMYPMALGHHYYLISNPIFQRFQRSVQGLALWPLASLLSFGMRTKSIVHLIRELRSAEVSRNTWIDVALMAIHYTLWLIVPMLFFSPINVLLTYLYVWMVVGLLLTAIFIAGHTGMPLVKEHNNPWLLQMFTSRNVKTGWWGAHLFVGLDNQIEHHLFPNISHKKMDVAASIVRRFAEERGLPYEEDTWWPVLKDVTRHMVTAWKDEAVVMKG
ncbi:MAG: fatty acid desaturase [Myxococcota bacterium]